MREIFISYAHIDNESLAQDQEGWVQLLDKRLRIRLAQLLGEPAQLWRDPKLQGNDELTDTLLSKIDDVDLLVSVLSPRYVKSEWCIRELDEFCRHAVSRGGLKLGGKSRVFKVVKTFIPRQTHPSPVQDLLGYEFYEYDELSGRVREFDPNGPKYWDKFEDLAVGITQLIESLQKPHKPGQSAATIYLAETTSDLREQRDRIRRELEQHGHEVLPDNELPLQAPAIQDAVREYLKRSRLSVHLIGEFYGIIPEMEMERSIVRLQYELASERGDDREFSRLIWLPPGLLPKDERQQKFVAGLQNSLSASNGSELLQVKLEDLKTIIQAKLIPPLKPAADEGDEAGQANIYLICDRQDVDAVAPLQNFLLDQGYEATLPLLDGSETEIVQDHKDNLLLCDAVLIFQGNAGEGWLRMKLRELIKLPGYGRTAPLLGKAVYIGGPESPAKERFRTLEAMVIKSYDEFDPASLKPFLAKIDKAKGPSL
jgi:TIR domain-containing protein/uncharacterized protein DUF4062